MKKTWMSLTAGILEILRGAWLSLAALALFGFSLAAPSAGWGMSTGIAFMVMVPIVVILAALSIAGGIFALKRKKWGLALAGSIAATLPLSILGIVSLVLVIISKKEFE